MKIDINHDLIKALQPFKRRLLLHNIVEYFLYSITAALILVLGLQLISFFFLIDKVWLLSGLVLIITVVIGQAAAWWKRPGLMQTVKAADRLGLKEKAVTALELSQRTDEYASLQRLDAILSLNTANPKAIAFSPPMKALYSSVILLLVLVGLSFVPNPWKDMLIQREQVCSEIEKQVEDISETVEKLSADKELSVEQQEQLAALVKEMTENLKMQSDYREAIKEITKAEEKFNDLMDDIASENLNKAAELLSAYEMTHSLAEALKEADSEAIQEALDSLREQIENGDNPEASKELAQALSGAAENLSPGSLQDGLASAAANLAASGDTDKQAGQLKQLKELFDNTANPSRGSAGEIKYALQQMKQDIAKAIGDDNMRFAQGNPNNGQQGNSSNSEQNQSNSSGNENSSGGQGEGSQNGSGASGSNGSGTGSQGEGSGQGGGIGTGVDERIYDPTRLGDGGTTTYVPGQMQNPGDSESQEGDRGLGDYNGYIPYREVFHEYRQDAMSGMSRRSLPPGIEELVKEYFTSLE